MQVAPAQLQSQQSPSSLKVPDTGTQSESPEDRVKMQFAFWSQRSEELRTQNEMSAKKLEEAESAERKQLHEKWLSEQKKEREKTKDVGHSLQVQNEHPTQSRKRKLEGGGGPEKYPQPSEYRPTFDGYNHHGMPPAPEHQAWMYQQQQQYQYMMQQRQAMSTQRHPAQAMMPVVSYPSVAPSMMPSGLSSMQNRSPQTAVYPPNGCSIAPSTSASMMPTDMVFLPSEAVPALPSPALVPSHSGTNSNATPPSNQVPNDLLSQNEAGATPPQITNLNDTDVVDSALVKNFVGVDQPVHLVELGADLGLEDLDFSLQPSTSDCLNAQPVSAATPSSSVMSPAGGMPMSVNGPHSVHSVHSNHNPMSNSACNPPMTPNNNPQSQQSACSQQMPLAPPTPTNIGAPLYHSTPIVPPTSTTPQMPVTSQEHYAMEPTTSMVQRPPSMQTQPMMPQMQNYPMAGQERYMGGYPTEMMNGTMNHMQQHPAMMGGHPGMGMPAMNPMQMTAQQQQYFAMMRQRQAAMLQGMNPQQQQQHHHMMMMQQRRQMEMYQQQQQQRMAAAAAQRYPMDPSMMARMSGPMPMNAMAASSQYPYGFPQHYPMS